MPKPRRGGAGGGDRRTNAPVAVEECNPAGRVCDREVVVMAKEEMAPCAWLRLDLLSGISRPCKHFKGACGIFERGEFAYQVGLIFTHQLGTRRNR